MDSFARNALRLSLAGAGVAVLGAGFVGQASAAEAPGADTLSPTAPDTSNVEPQLTGAVPSTADNQFSVAGTDLSSLGNTAALPTTATPTATTPSSDSLPSLADTQAFQVPDVTNLQAPGLS